MAIFHSPAHLMQSLHACLPAYLHDCRQSCNHAITTSTVAFQNLMDYLNTLSTYCEKFVMSMDDNMVNTRVEWIMVKADALMLKAQ